MIYFIKCGEYVKIGVAQNPKVRICELQTGNPYELELSAVIPGGQETEIVYHNLLSSQRVRGEWFTIDDNIESMIALFHSIFGLNGVDTGDARDTKIAMLEQQILDAPAREVYTGLYAEGVGKMNPIARDILAMMAGREDTQQAIAERHSVSAGYVSGVKSKMNGSGK